jgi:hypothetical protein
MIEVLLASCKDCMQQKAPMAQIHHTMLLLIIFLDGPDVEVVDGSSEEEQQQQLQQHHHQQEAGDREGGMPPGRSRVIKRPSNMVSRLHTLAFTDAFRTTAPVSKPQRICLCCLPCIALVGYETAAATHPVRTPTSFPARC